ncbi:hypothetical protein NQ314_003541 [Rhamnusium bicolor]|uniref:Uncharacterized protein n=1 Tax=Rhamnusium bicolor TaxID=1586634 RepID=A0AAV8ZMX7_9CUCU|nr:hypothetical protein NQ314_003541 [Rhamnusium bicolor]
MLQEELDTVAREWNMHRISSSRNSTAPKGRPFLMYHTPEVYGTIDYLCEVTQEENSICSALCIFSDKIPCDSDV